jgi:hypothetical protein
MAHALIGYENGLDVAVPLRSRRNELWYVEVILSTWVKCCANLRLRAGIVTVHLFGSDVALMIFTHRSVRICCRLSWREWGGRGSRLSRQTGQRGNATTLSPQVGRSSAVKALRAKNTATTRGKRYEGPFFKRMELIVRSNTLALGGYYMAERLTAWRANKAMMRFKRRKCQFLPQIRLLHTEG